MGRNIGAAVLGYVVMFVLVLVLSLGLLFVGDSMVVAGSIVVGLVAAIMGGVVCAKVATDAQGVWILIGAVVVIGLGLALLAGAATDVVMEADLADMESFEDPGWLMWVNPLIGAVGVYIGARLAKGV